jgi:butyryl-CoA dehydrogenase
MTYRCGQLADEDTMSEQFKSYAAMLKTYAAETAPKVALLAMNILGSYGPMREYQVERLMRDALIEPHIEVVSDVQRIITARYFIQQGK